MSAPLRRALLWSSVVVLAAGCVAAPTSGASPSAAAAVASPVASPATASSASSAVATPAAALNSSAASTGPTPALPPATVDVSPAQVPVGQFSVSMAVEAARHMLPQTVALTSDPDPAHQGPSTSSSASSTSLVLEGLLQLTNNVDASQPVPDDQPQSMVRHVGVEVRSGDGGASVPYLSASVDMLLDGHPVVSNIPLVPMVSDDSTTTQQLYYGNNFKLTQRGSYQAFVRLAPNALLGSDPPQAAQFNLVVH